MNFAPRYLGRGSWLAQRDPRVLVLAVVCFVFAAIQVWDARLMFALLVLAVAWYRSARIPFRDVRRLWLFAIVFISLLVFGNGIIASGRVQRLPEGWEQHVYLFLPLLGSPISAENLTFAVTQFLRFMGMIAIGMPLAFAIHPEVLGVTFARLGVPSRFAFAIDLTWRFIPSFAADVRTTLDAQRVRGMDFAPRAKGPIERLRRQIPVVVPTVVNAIAGAEDTIDAMDLRGFGTGPRTWLRELRLDRTDRIVLTAFVALLVGATIAGFTTSSSYLWIPPFMIPG
ncbi:MAG TPA: energy-coupling factor transporter transmembrane component T [Candidatus Deferrimicrobiaceae bacterium]|nr:energy-coupling factor transporter transmembrane component T [Candidatus Deferrimicrobiaceae bacterium]